MRLLLIRHTAPDVAPGICYGRLDVPARPPEQAAWLADWEAARLAHQPWTAYRRLLSSPSARCRTLAQALSDRLGLPLETDPAWQEMDFGAWEGRAWEAIGKPAVDAWAADPLDFAPGGGESLSTMMRRVVTAYEAWRRQGRDTVLVTHGGVIRLLQAWHACRPAVCVAPDPADLQSACLQALDQPPPMTGGLVLLE